MPGDEFSYEQSVGPVTQDNGYTYAPVISDGKLIQGIGGGVCQVSSTLYNTQLKSGILPTERRNHSHPVSYVPRGLDATLASGSIDYKFKNTHEYPIVINTHAGGGTLTIEFWSNEHALKGIEYKPVGYASGNTANSYLYGYDKDGKKVYEKHIDTSIYR
jgi:vancomycin resistance protein YoaR